MCEKRVKIFRFLRIIAIFLLVLISLKIGYSQELTTPKCVFEAPNHLNGLKNYLSKNFEKIYQDVKNKLQIPYESSIRCILATDYNEMNAILRKLTNSNSVLPDSVAGVCLKSISTIILNSYAFRNSPYQDAVKTFKHEIGHLLIGLTEVKNNLPIWFEEGLCQWSEQLLYYPGYGEAQLYSELKSTPTFNEIEAWMIQRKKLNRAYLTSHNAIEFLLRAGADSKLPIFYETFIETGDFADSFQTAFEESIQEFETRWHLNIKPSKVVNILNFIGGNWFVIIFGLLGIILVIGVLAKKKRYQPELKKMESEDELEDEEYAQTHSWAEEIERRKREKGLKIPGEGDFDDDDPEV